MDLKKEGTEKMILKKWIQLATALGALTIIIGCGGAPGEETTTPHSQTTPPATDAQPRDGVTTSNVDLGRPFACLVDPDSLGLMGTIPWTSERASQRWGHGLYQFSMVKSSKEVPVEICGANDSYKYISELACDDGFHPFSSVEQARDARVGSMGPGGSCGRIIDLYLARCPEGQYEIYVDMYHCAEGESLM